MELLGLPREGSYIIFLGLFALYIYNARNQLKMFDLFIWVVIAIPPMIGMIRFYPYIGLTNLSAIIILFIPSYIYFRTCPTEDLESGVMWSALFAGVYLLAYYYFIPKQFGLTQYDMSYGYWAAFPVCILTYYVRKGHFSFLLLIVPLFLTILFYGSRGPLLLSLLGILYYLLVPEKWNIKVVFRLVVLCLALFLVYRYYTSIILIISNRFGVMSRSIRQLLTNRFLQSNTREMLFHHCARLIYENKRGYGVLASRQLLNGYWPYPHSILYELMLDYGMVPGALLTGFILIESGYLLIYSKKNGVLTALIGYMTFVGLLMLFISSSLYYEYTVPALTALFVNCVIAVQNKKSESVLSAAGFNGGSAVPLLAADSELILSSDAVTVQKGNTYQLKAILSSGTNSWLTWSSSNEKVARVNQNGIVTGVGIGNAVITASVDGTRTKASCKVDVIRRKEEKPQLILANVFANDLRFVVTADNCTYTGKAIKPLVRVFDGIRPLVDKKDYVISYKNNIKAATKDNPDAAPTVFVTGKGNYDYIQELKFTIEPADFTKASVENMILAQSVQLKTLEIRPFVLWNETILKQGSAYDLDFCGWNQQDPGVFLLALKGKGNFIGIKTLKIHVLESDRDFIPVTNLKITAKSVTVSNEATFDTVLKESGFKVMDGKKELKKGKDYKVSGAKNYKKAGICTFTLTGNGELYQGSITVPIIMKGKNISKAKAKQNTVYNGKKKTLKGIDLCVGDTILVRGKDYRILEDTYENNIHVGKASVMVEGIGEYSGRAKITFNIIADPAKAASAPKSKAAKKNTESVSLVITLHPKDAFAKWGDEVLFTVRAKGNKIKYSWEYSRDNGTAWETFSSQEFPTSVKANFRVRVTSKDDGALIRCKVTSGQETLYSNTAELHVF